MPGVYGAPQDATTDVGRFASIVGVIAAVAETAPSPGAVTVTVAVTLSPVIRGAANVPRQQATDMTVCIQFGMLRTLLGPEWRPLAVRFAHPAPSHVETFRAFFGPEVEFDAISTSVVLSRHDFERRLPQSDPVMAEYARQYVEGLMRRSGTDTTGPSRY